MIRGSTGVERLVRAIIDTGFTGSLTLAFEIVDELSLSFIGNQRALLADGREIEVAVYSTRVVWDGSARRVSVLATDGAPLIGMSLLAGYALSVQVVDQGAVRMTPLRGP